MAVCVSANVRVCARNGTLHSCVFVFVLIHICVRACE